MEEFKQRQHFVIGESLPEAYHKALEVLYEHGIEAPCPDYDTEQKEVGMTMVVNQPLLEPRISRLAFIDPKSLEQYCQEVLDGILDFAVEHGYWDYTYHQLMEAQIPEILNVLKENMYSRRAVIILPTAEIMKLDSPPCLQRIQYLYRDGLLNCDVDFRSNDAVKATFTNAFALTMLQQRMANELGVGVGQYTHRANSFHAYKNDYEILEGYVRRIQSGNNLTYNYADDWQDEMKDNEVQEEIKQYVLERKNKCNLK